MRQPTPNGVIYGHFPHRVAHPPPKKFMNNLWLIDGHLWPKKHQENFMTIIIAYARACDIKEPKHKKCA